MMLRHDLLHGKQPIRPLPNEDLVGALCMPLANLQIKRITGALLDHQFISWCLLVFHD